MRGTRIRRSTATNCGLSPRCPAVSTNDNAFAALLAREVNLRRPSATRPAQRVIAWLNIDAARRFLLPVAVPTGAGSVLMGPETGRVHADVPPDPTGGIGVCLQRGQQPLPRPVPPRHRYAGHEADTPTNNQTRLSRAGRSRNASIPKLTAEAGPKNASPTCGHHNP